MRMGLACQNASENKLKEIMRKNGILLDNDSEIYIVEEEFIAKDKLSIIVNMNRLDLLERLLKSIALDTITNKIIGQVDDRLLIIELEKVLFFEAKGSSVYCHTKDDAFKVKEKLYELEEILPKDKFIRVNKSAIVHANKISEIIPWFNRRLLLKFTDSTKDEVVSKNYTGEFKKFIGISR